jgi:hypothetical protein
MKYQANIFKFALLVSLLVLHANCTAWPWTGSATMHCQSTPELVSETY